MKGKTRQQWIEIGLRWTLAFSFISAVADRIGLWPKAISSWGNWQSFIEYTSVLNPWFPLKTIPAIAGIVSILEIILACLLLLGIKKQLTSIICGILLCSFSIAMTINVGIKPVLDYSVLPLCFSAFSLQYLNK